MCYEVEMIRYKISLYGDSLFCVNFVTRIYISDDSNKNMGRVTSPSRTADHENAGMPEW